MNEQVVHVRINDAATGRATPVRVRFVGPDGQTIAPLGRLREFPTGWHEDVGGSVMLGDRRFAYIDGTCEIVLPAGPIEIEASKGPEYIPFRHRLERKAGQISLRLNIERRFYVEKQGWFAGDTQVFFLSPQAAALEGSAEGLHVVNVLAAQWNRDGRPFVSSLLEFSGQEPAYSHDDRFVFVNTQNCHHRDGALSLLNCHRIVHPLTCNEEDFSEWTLADWCAQCHRKGGLVVWPNFPDRIGKPKEELLRGQIDAVEWTAGNGFETAGLSEWYRLLNAGYRVPLVGGSGKASNAIAVGAMRTYAQLEPGQPFDYKSWIEAIRAGKTFVTSGPLIRMTANGQGPGSTLSESAAIQLHAESESTVPYDRLQVIADGDVIADVNAGADINRLATATLDFPSNRLPPEKSHWVAARCLESGRLCAHTSPIYVSTP